MSEAMGSIEKEVFVPKRTPSLNDWKGVHWRTYFNEFKKPWLRDLSWFLPRRTPFTGKRTMALISYQPPQGFYDFDNHVGGAKPVLDALKTLGWIKNDSRKWLICDYQQRLVGEDNIHEVGTKIILYL